MYAGTDGTREHPHEQDRPQPRTIHEQALTKTLVRAEPGPASGQKNQRVTKWLRCNST